MRVSLEGKDGYAQILAAIAQMPDDAGLHFAAALITTAPAQKDAHVQHLTKARQGARADVLLARNLATHYLGE